MCTDVGEAKCCSQALQLNCGQENLGMTAEKVSLACSQNCYLPIPNSLLVLPHLTLNAKLQLTIVWGSCTPMRIVSVPPLQLVGVWL